MSSTPKKAQAQAQAPGPYLSGDQYDAMMQEIREHHAQLQSQQAAQGIAAAQLQRRHIDLLKQMIDRAPSRRDCFIAAALTGVLGKISPQGLTALGRAEAQRLVLAAVEIADFTRLQDIKDETR